VQKPLINLADVVFDDDEANGLYTSRRATSVERDSQDLDAPSLPEGLLSGKCQGLRLDNGQIDAAHIYWNPGMRKFSDWVR
jgi:hypothetical protein